MTTLALTHRNERERRGKKSHRINKIERKKLRAVKTDFISKFQPTERHSSHSSTTASKFILLKVTRLV